VIFRPAVGGLFGAEARRAAARAWTIERTMFDERIGRALLRRPKQAERAPPRVFAIALGLAAAGFSGAVAQTLGVAPRVLFDAAACREAKALSDEECETAYANAKAEFDEKAPRFASRAACERYFRRCMIGDIMGGGRRVAFIPQMRGFAIEQGRERRVVPVADGSGAAGLFQPRPVDHPDAFVSAAKTAEAQKAWKLTIASPDAAARVPSSDDGASEPASAGPARAYPLPPSMLQDLKKREGAFGSPPNP
jgi:hypothetical protein